MTLGDVIKQYRNENKISMEQFSKMAGLTKGYISMLESNKNPNSGKPINPSLETVEAIAKAMRVGADELLSRMDDDQKIIIGTMRDKKKHLMYEAKPNIDFDDFDYALKGSTDNMTDEQKSALLDMAQVVENVSPSDLEFLSQAISIIRDKNNK